MCCSFYFHIFVGFFFFICFRRLSSIQKTSPLSHSLPVCRNTQTHTNSPIYKPIDGFVCCIRHTIYHVRTGKLMILFVIPVKTNTSSAYSPSSFSSSSSSPQNAASIVAVLLFYVVVKSIVCDTMIFKCLSLAVFFEICNNRNGAEKKRKKKRDKIK